MVLINFNGVDFNLNGLSMNLNRKDSASNLSFLSKTIHLVIVPSFLLDEVSHIVLQVLHSVTNTMSLSAREEHENS